MAVFAVLLPLLLLLVVMITPPPRCVEEAAWASWLRCPERRSSRGTKAEVGRCSSACVVAGGRIEGRLNGSECEGDNDAVAKR